MAGTTAGTTAKGNRDIAKEGYEAFRARPEGISPPPDWVTPFKSGYPFVEWPYTLMLPIFVCVVFAVFMIIGNILGAIGSAGGEKKAFKEQSEKSKKIKKLQRQQHIEAQLGHSETATYQEAYYDLVKVQAGTGVKDGTKNHIEEIDDGQDKVEDDRKKADIKEKAKQKVEREKQKKVKEQHQAEQKR